MSLHRLIPIALAGALTAGCASLPSAPPAAAFVVIGPDGAASARVLTHGAQCPNIVVDGRSAAMTVRAAAGVSAQRPTGSLPELSKPSAFDVLTCEAPIDAGAVAASIDGRPLALPRARPRRIVVIGDTGCRLKAPDEYQDCNSAAAYPFARVAALAAAWAPDLVVHVGDYHYREHPCPAGRAGCAGSPWGYGADVWQADFFTLAAPLLKAAPWVFARGNHESCTRAGQGWWRFLDPRPLLAGRDCESAADDAKGDFSDPYAVPLGDGAQLVVLDTAATSYKGLAPGDPRFLRYADSYRALAALTAKAPYTIMVDHHPVLGFGAARGKDGQVTLRGGDQGLIDAFGSVDAALLPPKVQLLLSGHVHLWQQVSFRSDHPSQFISGFSGTAEDTVPLPAQLPDGASPAPGALVDAFSSWVDGFGYMTMERSGAAAWDVKVWDLQGVVRNRCKVEGKQSHCEQAQVH